ncbi:MAG: hypothetical protein BRD41_03675 [Bacteroidetes bacterium QS_1_63_11]|nr:MAG: hypothetical protein BRD41_03675 [Bacteroidetes bacterium QS_1_63_11]
MIPPVSLPCNHVYGHPAHRPGLERNDLRLEDAQHGVGANCGKRGNGRKTHGLCSIVSRNAVQGRD